MLDLSTDSLWITAKEWGWFVISSYLMFRLAKCLYIISRSILAHFLTKKHDLTYLLNSWTVVTGCTDGIGRAYAKELAATRGVRKFFLIGRSKAKLNAVVKELWEYNCECKIAVFDFAHDDLEDLPKELKTLDIGILINCVGIAPQKVGNLLELEPLLGSKIVRVNLLSCVRMCELILPGMVQRDRGIIVNFASMTGWRPLPYMSTYPATKAAISFFTDTLADEFSHTNVRINCLIPMLVATKIASYENHEANDIFVIRTDTYAKQAVNIIGNYRLSTGCFFHDMQIAFGTLVSFWVFKQLFVPLIMLGVHKDRVDAYQAKNKSP